MSRETILNFIGGTFVQSNGKTIDVLNPSDNSVLAQVEFATASLIDLAVEKAKEAEIQWKNQTFKKRTEVIFNLRNLLIKNQKELAECIRRENGKSEIESEADVAKAIESCEFAVSLPALISGRTQYVSTGIEVKELIKPVGIVVSITPFNFPLMVPMWTIPNVLVTGNAMILKPSEQTPMTASLLAALLQEAGLPAGLFSVINGGKDIVEALCDHPDIQVITFVGSTPIAETVYKRATSHLKRCLALGGAKNHLIVTDDVDQSAVAGEITAAAYGMSGQRCMAASVVLAVGKCDRLINEIVELSKKYLFKNTLPPLISMENVHKLHDYLNKTTGSILVDGRNADKCDATYSCFVGPSVILYDTYAEMPKQEIFAPTLEVIRCATLDEALRYQNESPYANGASIFTGSGRYASDAVNEMSAGMLGVNIGIPVPRDPYSFGGLKSSKFGYGDISGYDSIHLFTETQKITTKWDPKEKKDWAS